MSLLTREVCTSGSYAAYFKRSWAIKSGGAYVGLPPFTSRPDVFPLQYGAIADYWGPQVGGGRSMPSWRGLGCNLAGREAKLLTSCTSSP